MNIRNIAKALGRRGGEARAKRLSPDKRGKIASLGGKARAGALLIARRIARNFRYLAAVRALRNQSRKVTTVKDFRGRLPGIHA